MKVNIKSKRLSARPRRNVTNLKKGVIKQVNKIFKEGVKEYIRAATTHVPRDTGMSLATYIPLASKVKLGGYVSSLASGGHRKAGHRSNYGRPVISNVHVCKSTAFGERLGRKKLDFNLASTTEPSANFQFTITALQHYIWENERSPHWNTLQVGELAYTTYMRNNLTKALPNFSQWLINGRLIDGKG